MGLLKLQFLSADTSPHPISILEFCFILTENTDLTRKKKKTLDEVNFKAFAKFNTSTFFCRFYMTCPVTLLISD